jgi:hypothetical protein
MIALFCPRRLGQCVFEHRQSRNAAIVMAVCLARFNVKLDRPRTRGVTMTVPQMGKAILALGLFCSGISSAQAEFIVLRSGNGVVGGTDSQVNMLVGPFGNQFPLPFTAADFTSARTGPAAFIIAPHPSWPAGLAGDSSAKWISTSANGAVAGNTALYAISFTLTQPFSSATLDLNYAVDNFLGRTSGGLPGVNQGVFLNGTAISGDSTGGNENFTELTLFRTDIAPLLQVGTNTLYFNAVNAGGTSMGPAGFIFRATITTTESTNVVPEPSTLVAGMVGVTSLVGYGWRRRRLR